MVEIEPPARFGDDAAAIAVWYLEDRGLTATDLVEEAPGGPDDAPTALVKRERSVVGKVTVGSPVTVETCADFAG